MAITHKYTLICDDIRREDNGKLMILGMYGPVVLVPQIPFTLPTMAFLVAVESDRLGQWGMKFRVQLLETGRALIEGNGFFGVQQPGFGLASIKFSQVTFQALGVYNFIVQIEEHRDPIITEFSVQLPSQMPTSQLPPSFRG
jgi:hypothetical protein